MMCRKVTDKASKILADGLKKSGITGMKEYVQGIEKDICQNDIFNATRRTIPLLRWSKRPGMDVYADKLEMYLNDRDEESLKATVLEMQEDVKLHISKKKKGSKKKYNA
jgi:hypothetical protein